MPPAKGPDPDLAHVLRELRESQGRSQESLAHAAGIVREVIRALEERGVVTVRHGRGATVAPQASRNVLDRDALLTLLASRSRRSVMAGLAETRAVLEIEAAA